VLSSTSSGQLQSQHEYNSNSNETTEDKTHTKTKIDQLRLFTFKHELLKIYLRLQTAFAAEIHLAEGQWLEEQLNTLKLRMFRVRTRMLTV
jgi:hypothetical protein